MSIVNYADLVSQYKSIRESGIPTEDVEQHIQYAQAELESVLGVAYTVPFSSNNLTAKDMVLRLAYSRVAPLPMEDRGKVRGEVIDRAHRLIAGREIMATASGTLEPSAAAIAWSSTQDYNPIFTIDHPINWVVDSQQIQDIRDDRN